MKPGAPWTMYRCPFIGPQTCGLGARDLFQKNNSMIIKIPVTFAHKTLIFSNINPQSKSITDFTPRFLVFEFYLQISLAPPILHINPSALSKLHILFSRAPVIF
jgi:hypothetical protein